MHSTWHRACTQMLNKALLKSWKLKGKAASNKQKFQIHIMDFESFSFLMPSKPINPQLPELYRQIV
jgi:hypothetical protein